jgi:hypothetical protein
MKLKVIVYDDDGIEQSTFTCTKAQFELLPSYQELPEGWYMIEELIDS